MSVEESLIQVTQRMTELPVNQKEYLKKYLGIGKAPGEKKKKKKKPTVNRIQIIDDDAVVTVSNDPTDDDVLLANEDAPQIVAIIDERPPSMRIDEKTKNPLWQPIGAADNNQTQQKQMIKGFKIQAKSNDKLASRDISPPRRKRHVENENSSQVRKSKSDNFLADIVIKEERSVSPSDDNSPRMRDKSEEIDLSPPRRGKVVIDKTESRSRQDDDSSPTRRSKNVERDLSPPRRGKERDNGRSQLKNHDITPPRRSTNVEEDISPPRKGREQGDKSRSRSRWDDSSPPRRRNKERNLSPARANRDARGESTSKVNSSPYRKNRKIEKDTSDKARSHSRYDNSPPRKSRKTENSPRGRNLSPPRKSKKEENTKSLNDEKRPQKVEKTTKHGLVDASELEQETRNLQKQQETLFNSLPVEASGQNSETVFRDRQTGRVRNLQEEEERQQKKQEEEEKKKEKYERWGRGLAQVESQTQKLADQLHEMSKPLARYADDEDLEKFLKEQEREGDPMLAYIRKKKRKKAADAGEVIKPQFEGQFMPNRYGIRPGHRWDGVDRSNGYEKKWFEVQNEKKALQEDSYKWSTEDM